MLLNKLSIIVALLNISSASQSANELLPREEFTVPLAKLSVTIDPETKKSGRVKISFEDSKDQIIIGVYDDIHIKNSRNSTEKVTYREIPDRAYQVTDFEAEQILRVSKTLVSTLEIFERDLQNLKRGKWLYLDAYLPRFLIGYCSLIEVATNFSNVLPESVYISDSLFEISIHSEKSDSRIKQWYKTPEHIVKLRIATKELIFQLKVWQHQNLGSKRNPEKLLSNDFINSISLFIRFYFNQNPRIQKK